jgi:hypothetical protein
VLKPELAGKSDGESLNRSPGEPINDPGAKFRLTRHSIAGAFLFPPGSGRIMWA